MTKAIKKILYLQPSVGDKVNPMATEKFNNLIQEYLDRHTSPGYKISIRNIAYGGELPTSEYYVCVSAPYIVEEMLKAEKEGYAGIIVGCFGNPAVREAREVVNIPIVGPGEAACHLACLLGDRISILGTGAIIPHKGLKLNEKYHHQFYTSIWREVQAQGLLGRVISIRTTGRSSEGGTGAFAEAGLESEYEALLKQGVKAIEEDGADVLVLGCALMMGVADKLQKELGVPVVDSTLAAIKFVEMLISMKLKHSVLSYPFTSVESDQVTMIYPPTLKGYHGYHKSKIK